MHTINTNGRIQLDYVIPEMKGVSYTVRLHCWPDELDHINLLLFTGASANTSTVNWVINYYPKNGRYRDSQIHKLKPTEATLFALVGVLSLTLHHPSYFLLLEPFKRYLDATATRLHNDGRRKRLCPTLLSR